jgi:hypothetical protein
MHAGAHAARKGSPARLQRNGLGRGNKVQHQPLGKALQQHAGARNKQALLALLRPIHQACERSPFLRELADSGSVFHPLGWTPAEAYRFLKDIPAFESSGIVVRVPDWWKAGRPSRPQVQVQVGGRPAAGLGLDALLDFSVEVVLDGERLTKRELLELGVSRSTFQNWVSSGVLARTHRRGVYRTTASTQERIEAALRRRR